MNAYLSKHPLRTRDPVKTGMNRIIHVLPITLLERVDYAVPQLERMMSNARELGHKAEIQSVAAAIQNMLLMAHSLDLGSLWINNIYYALDALEQHLDKPWELVATVALGWPTEQERHKTPPNKLTVDEVAEFRE